MIRKDIRVFICASTTPVISHEPIMCGELEKDIRFSAIREEFPFHFEHQIKLLQSLASWRQSKEGRQIIMITGGRKTGVDTLIKVFDTVKIEAAVERGEAPEVYMQNLKQLIRHQDKRTRTTIRPTADPMYKISVGPKTAKPIEGNRCEGGSNKSWIEAAMTSACYKTQKHTTHAPPQQILLQAPT